MIHAMTEAGGRQGRRRCTLLCLMLLCWCTIALAQVRNRISVSFSNEKATTALKRVEKLSGLKIQYNYDDVNFRVTLKADNQAPVAVVNRLISGHGLHADRKDDYIVIMRTANIPHDKNIGDGKHLVGIVMDESGEPIIGAVIRDRANGVGTVTDADGKFSIEAKSDRIVLNVSSIGMKDNQWRGNRDDYAVVVLEDNAQELDNVVITGYQQLDRRNLTSSVTSVKMSDIDRPGMSSLDKMLQGRIPDLVVSNASGEINAVPKIRIRGTSTLIGDREPLWVVDGIIVSNPVNLSASVLNDPDYVNRIGNAISGINPQDIDRIDVLKDASATALYGTRAANGVIVITTKKGREGKPIISYNYTGTYRRRPRYSDRKIDLMDSKERTAVSRDMVGMHYKYPSSMVLVGYEDAIDKYYSGQYSWQQFQDAVNADETRNTDWFKLLCRDAVSSDHSVNISGGSDKFRYYASVGYTNDEDVIKDNYNNRITSATNLDFNLSQKFALSLQLSSYHSRKRYDKVNAIDYAYNTSRVIPAYNDDGTYYYYKGTATQGAYNYNILNELDNSYNKQKDNGFKSTFNLKYTAYDWLYFNAIASFSTANTTQEGWYGEKSYYAANERQSEYGVTPDQPSMSKMPFGGELSENNTDMTAWTMRLQGNMNKYFGANLQHNINLAVGVEASSTHYTGNSYTQRGYYSDRGKKFVTSIPNTYTSYLTWLSTNMPTIVDTRTNLLSAYGTLSYSYKTLFTLNANTRYDGSNKFGDRSNEKILPVWSVSGLANVLDITNWHPKWIDNLTWKISYGGQGNMLDGQTPVLTITKGALDTHYNEMTSTVANFANPNLKWEQTHSFNTGLEMAFLHNRLMMEIEYYHKMTVDAFMNKTISDINGFTSYVVNSGKILNKGYNFSITATPVQTKNWNWLLSASLSKIINRMETTPGGDTYKISDYLDGTALVNGQAIGTFYSYRFIGLNPLNGGPLFDDWQDRANELVGLDNYETAMRVLSLSGRRDPDITGSISSSLTYKNWRLGIFLDYAAGNKIRLFKLYGQNGGNSDPGQIYPQYNLNRAVLNRWKKPGDELYTNIPAIMSSDAPGYYQYSQHWSNGSNYQGVAIANDAWTMYDYSDLRVVSADYLRIASISLTYELPANALRQLHLERLAMTLTGNNLYTFCNSKLKGQTPTQSGFAEVQLSDTPYFTLGVNIQF